MGAQYEFRRRASWIDPRDEQHVAERFVEVDDQVYGADNGATRGLPRRSSPHLLYSLNTSSTFCISSPSLPSRRCKSLPVILVASADRFRAIQRKRARNHPVHTLFSTRNRGTRSNLFRLLTTGKALLGCPPRAEVRCMIDGAE